MIEEVKRKISSPLDATQWQQKRKQESWSWQWRTHWGHSLDQRGWTKWTEFQRKQMQRCSIPLILQAKQRTWKINENFFRQPGQEKVYVAYANLNYTISAHLSQPTHHSMCKWNPTVKQPEPTKIAQHQTLTESLQNILTAKINLIDMHEIICRCDFHPPNTRCAPLLTTSSVVTLSKKCCDLRPSHFSSGMLLSCDLSFIYFLRS